MADNNEISPADEDLNERLRNDFSLLNAAMSNVVRRDVQGTRVAVGDLAITTEMGKSDDRRMDTVTQSAAYYSAEGLRFPRFTLQPENMLLKLFSFAYGLAKIEFPAHPDFARAYHLSAVHEENTRMMFDDRVLNTLVRSPGLHICSGANALLIYQPGRQYGPDELEGFISETAQIFRLFEESARQMKLAAETRVTPKADVRAIAEKIPGFTGQDIRNSLVIRSELMAFVNQTPPREIPDNILQYCETSAPKIGLLICIVFAITGGSFAAAFGINGNIGGMIFGLVVFVIGGSTAFFVGRARMRITRLLRHGQLGSANIESIGPGLGEGDLCIGARHYAEGQVWHVTFPWHERSNAVGDARKRAEKLAAEKKPTPILYDPKAPQRVLIVEALLNVSPEYEP